MTAASATPQQMRDRLLQAIDSQSNIRNMVAVLEVISYLERYPITKEALEETRLGKLINDVRKKTKDEDLAKRAKKLLRNWQKLIEPGQAEATPRGAGLGPATPGSANGGAHPPCRPEATPPRLSPELKGRNDFHNTYSPKAEKGRKRKGDARHSPAPPAKVAKATAAAYERLCNSSTPPPTNGVGGSPEPLHLPGEADAPRAEPQENDKQSRIPVNAVRPRPGPAPSTSSLLRAAVLQQHAKMEEPPSPRCVSRHPARSTPPRPAPSPPPPTSPLPPLTPPLAPPLLPQHEASSPSANAIGRESDGGGASGSDRAGKRRKKRYRPRDYRVNLGGPAEGGGAKPVRLKERRLTFDPNTGQIRPLAHSREPGLGEGRPEPLRTEPPPEAPAPPLAPQPLPADQLEGAVAQRDHPVLPEHAEQRADVVRRPDAGGALLHERVPAARAEPRPRVPQNARAGPHGDGGGEPRGDGRRRAAGGGGALARGERLPRHAGPLVRLDAVHIPGPARGRQRPQHPALRLPGLTPPPTQPVSLWWK